MNGKGMLVVAIILMCVGFGNVIRTVATEPASTPTPSAVHIPAPSPGPEPTAPIQESGTTLVKEWAGSGIKTTEPFTINNTPWSISWTNTPETIDGESMGILQIMVYKTTNPDFPITLAANTMDAASDTCYIYETGTFYLTINAANTQWIVRVHK